MDVQIESKLKPHSHLFVRNGKISQKLQKLRDKDS